MTENEQIEEMAKIIGIPCYKRIEAYGDGSQECPSPLPCNECTAELLYKAGYRKVERGEWIGTREAFAPHPYVYNCSVCGFKISHCAKMAYKFCANCGADMRGNDNER